MCDLTQGLAKPQVNTATLKMQPKAQGILVGQTSPAKPPSGPCKKQVYVHAGASRDAIPTASTIFPPFLT